MFFKYNLGMAYGFSVFWLPLSKAVGVSQGGTEPIPCKYPNVFSQLFVTECDWEVKTLGLIYSMFFIFLGSAGICGPWLVREGPRKAACLSACCWAGNFLNLLIFFL